MEMKKDFNGNHIGNRERPLSDREVRTLINRANGLTLEETGQAEHVSGNTIKTRLRLATYKLGARGTTNAVALAQAAGIIKDWQINAGEIPLHVLREANSRWVDLAPKNHNVGLGSSIKLHLVELQLIEHGPAADGKIRLQLSGWLKEPCPALFSIQEVVLTEAILPERIVPTGQRVRVRAVQRGDAYGVGVYVSMRWPKE